MTELTTVAYWEGRQENLDQCSDRLANFLTKVSSLSPGLSQWYEKGDTKRGAEASRISLEVTDVRRVLEKGRTYDDTRERRSIDRMGFCVGLWTGEHSGESASLNVVCGSSSTSGGPNHVILDYPADWLDVGRVVELVHAMVSCWSPLTVSVCSDDALLECSEKHGVEVPVIDWVFFHRLQRTGALRPPSRVAFELDGGECVVVQDRPVQPDRVDDRARVRELAKQLGLPESAPGA